MLECRARRLQREEVAPEFLAVGKVYTAFLTCSVKGGGRELQPKRQLKSQLQSFRVLAIKLQLKGDSADGFR